jgi:hypothetical protein
VVSSHDSGEERRETSICKHVLISDGEAESICGASDLLSNVHRSSSKSRDVAGISGDCLESMPYRICYTVQHENEVTQSAQAHNRNSGVHS